MQVVSVKGGPQERAATILRRPGGQEGLVGLSGRSWVDHDNWTNVWTSWWSSAGVDERSFFRNNRHNTVPAIHCGCHTLWLPYTVAAIHTVELPDLGETFGE